jgi:hypothetical protein
MGQMDKGSRGLHTISDRDGTDGFGEQAMMDLTMGTGKPTKTKDKPDWVDFIEEDNGCWLVCYRCETKEHISELHITDTLEAAQKHFYCKKKRQKMVRTKFPEGGNEDAVLQTD